MGKMMFSLLGCSGPFPSSSPDAPEYTDDQIPSLPPSLSVEFRGIITACVRSSPYRRPSAAEVWRLVAVLVFGPSLAHVLTGGLDCALWLSKQHQLLFSGAYKQHAESKVQFEQRVKYLSSSTSKSVWDDGMRVLQLEGEMRQAEAAAGRK